MKFVYDLNKEYSNVVLIKAVKGGNYGMVVEKPIIIDRNSGRD
jgi:tRNA1(Val) A37 N6-methylase TrmN6